jgi:hypothetical protein
MTRSSWPRSAWFVLFVTALLIAPSGVALTASAAPDSRAAPAAGAPRLISEATLARRADAIVLGTVAEAFSAWNEEYTLIYTHYAIAVADAITGEPAPTVRLRIAGGRVGDTTLAVSHAPVLTAGEVVVLFLKAGPETATAGRYFLCGADAGVLAVENGLVQSTGEPLASFKARVQDLAR